MESSRNIMRERLILVALLLVASVCYTIMREYVQSKNVESARVKALHAMGASTLGVTYSLQGPWTEEVAVNRIVESFREQEGEEQLAKIMKNPIIIKLLKFAADPKMRTWYYESDQSSWENLKGADGWLITDESGSVVLRIPVVFNEVHNGDS
jgi:hypothetical protein